MGLCELYGGRRGRARLGRSSRRENKHERVFRRDSCDFCNVAFYTRHILLGATVKKKNDVTVRMNQNPG